MSKDKRPRKYTQVLAQEICARIAQGESLRRVADDPAMPELGTLVSWLDRHPAFRSAYERAREIEADILADEVVDIADDEATDNATAVKLRVDARKWLAAKLKPDTYGEAKVSKRQPSARPVVLRVSTGVPRAPDQPADAEPQAPPRAKDEDDQA